MKIRSALFPCLFLLSACSSSNSGGTGDQSGGSTNGGSSNGGSSNNNGGSSNGGSNHGGSSNGGVSNGGSNHGGSNTGGVTNGGSNNGGDDAGDTDAGTDNGGAGSGGTSSGIPTTCGMPVPNTSEGNTCYNAAPPGLKLTQILAPSQPMFAPLMLASPVGDTHRQFVIVRKGFIRIIKDGALLPDPFLDISALTTNNNGEQENGLLGIAFDPDFANNKKIWIHYNQPDLTSTIASVLVSDANPDVANADSLTTMLEIPQPYDNHNGGMLAFGRDGCLYASFGDGGSGDDPAGRGQNTAEPLASILRLDTKNYNKTNQAMSTAPGNPGFMDNRVWNYGLRNPFRFSFDMTTGDMYIGDVGQNNWEEVDIEPAGVGGLNYGWDVLEGTHMHEGPFDTTGKRMPVIEYDHSDGKKAIIGGYVYRGSAIPQMVGRYVYSDFETKQFWTLVYKGEDANGQPQICDKYDLTDLTTGLASFDNTGGVTAIGQDASGELYVLTLNGGIYRIDAK